MRFRVVITHQRGIPRSRGHLARAEGVVGDVVTAYREDAYLRRMILVAGFSEALGDLDARSMLGELLDARCVRITTKGVLLAGFERQEVPGGQFAEYAQGWWLRPMLALPRSYAHKDDKAD